MSVATFTIWVARHAVAQRTPRMVERQNRRFGLKQGLANQRSVLCLTLELSGRRRQARWSARGASEFPGSVERRGEAAVRLQRLVR